ncbi:MAG: hypothetical protein H7320_02600 [Ferruginibacter sp.]|nr:hypothetical protein [Ferruginibacter sp.]
MKKLALPSLLFCTLILFINNFKTIAQAMPAKPVADTVKWGFQLYGFVRNDVMYDSRQIVSVREGVFSIFPKDKLLDANGKDINAAPTFHMLAIASRIGANINGPNAFGAKTSALFEAEFFGNFDGGINEFRLRHAFAKLDWKKTQLAFGQYWHPMFVPDCYPGVIDFNTGVPFQPFNRSPQIRLTQKLDKANKLGLILAVIAQRDFASVAPTGYAATDPFRNAALPNLHAQLQYKDAHLVAGLGVDYKSLRPRLSSGTPSIVSNEKVNSTSFIAYLKVITKPVIFKAEAVSGENLTDHVMLGGYLGYVASPVSIETYAPTKTKSFWFDVAGTNKKVIPGIFVGYTESDGAGAGASAAYGRAIGITGRGIKNIFRISPRIEFLSGKFKFGTEMEYTATQYGTLSTDAKIAGTTDNINNTRLLFTTTFSF